MLPHFPLVLVLNLPKKSSFENLIFLQTTNSHFTRISFQNYFRNQLEIDMFFFLVL